jgi:hypothetical protein
VRFLAGDGYAVYRGPVTDSAEHRHAAFQIAIAPAGEVAILDVASRRWSAAALVVAPMAPHRMLASHDVLTYFIEPQSAFADRLRERYGDGIAPAPELHSLREADIAAPSVRPSADLRIRLPVRELYAAGW